MPNKFYDLIRDEFLDPAGLINKELSFRFYVIRDEFLQPVGHIYDLREVVLWVYRNSSEPMRTTKDVFDSIDLFKPLIDQDLEQLYNLMKSLS